MDLEEQIDYLEDDVVEPMEDFKVSFNQTALAILYERLNQQRACMERDYTGTQRCEDGNLYKSLMGYGFLVLCFVAIVGNCLNLLVYISEQIRFFIAIRMLCTKLLVNTLTMLFLLPQAFRSIGLWEAGSSTDEFYWKLWPYQAFFVNVFGFIGMWMTVLMTAECYLHVFMPLKSKFICTKNNLLRSYLLISLIAILLAGIYPLNRLVVLRSECNNIIVSISVANSYFLNVYEQFHMLANLLFAIVIPLILLVFMSVAIVWRLNASVIGGKSMSSPNGNNVGRFGSEKRTVIRITLITTSLQLFSELPSVPVFAFASLFGPALMNKTSHLCTWQTLSQFIGIFNVSLSFFVYVMFSPRFRQSIISRLCGQWTAPRKSSRSFPSKKLSTTRLDESRLLSAPRNSSVGRKESTCSDETPIRPHNARFLSISSGNTAATDIYSSASKNSNGMTNFL